MPFDFSISGPQNPIDIYYNPSMIIMDGRRGVDFPSDSHAHAGYEFVIPISSLEVIQLEKGTFPAEFHKIQPINAEQIHGSAGCYNNCGCFAWNIEADLIKSLANSMYGKPEVKFANEPVRISREIRTLLGWFMEEYQNKQAGSCFILDGLATQLAVTLLRQVKNNCSHRGEKKVLSANPNIERTIEYMHDNYQARFSLRDVAHIANLSPYHFLRLFKTQTGKTPYAYLLNLKIEKAKQLLKGKKHTVTEVCFLCGFNNTSHFATLFKRMVGLPPSDFIKSQD